MIRENSTLTTSTDPTADEGEPRSNAATGIQMRAVMNLEQGAAYLQVSKAHLSNILRGKVMGVPPLRSVRAGRRILIKREWIDVWLESQPSHGDQC